MLGSTQHIASPQVDTEIALLLLRELLEDLPAGSAALEAGVGERLGQDNVDDLFPEQQFPTPRVLDDIGYGLGGGGPLLWLRTLQVLDDGQDLFFAEGHQLRIRQRLDRLRNGVRALGFRSAPP